MGEPRWRDSGSWRQHRRSALRRRRRREWWRQGAEAGWRQCGGGWCGASSEEDAKGWCGWPDPLPAAPLLIADRMGQSEQIGCEPDGGGGSGSGRIGGGRGGGQARVVVAATAAGSVEQLSSLEQGEFGG